MNNRLLNKILLVFAVVTVVIGSNYFDRDCDCSVGNRQNQEEPAGSSQHLSGSGHLEAAEKSGVSYDAVSGVKVTFIELGSVNCIPCKMMQPIMKEIEEKYKGQVRVLFHDVWTEQGKSQGTKYKVRVIPTQVFLDASGKEFYRHEGFFPKDELIKVLKTKGVN